MQTCKPDSVGSHGTSRSTTVRTMMEPHVGLSVVLPFRNEKENLAELLARLRIVLHDSQLTYELIFVDDGSDDDGAAVIEAAAAEDRRVTLLVLSRNFGQHVAGTAGIDAACGAMVIWMDTDLQERPEDIPAFVEKCREGFDVVYARRRVRRQPKLRAAASHAALKLMNRLVQLDVSADRACMRLFTRKVAQSLRGFEERNRYMGYLMPWAGFRTAEIDIEIDPRKRGETKYSIIRLMRLAWTGVTAFSAAPLRVAAVLSVATVAMCAIGVAYVIYRYFAYGFVISGWASLIIAMLLLHSLQFAVTAVLGEYVGLTYTEAKRRPLYFLSRRINLDDEVPRAVNMPAADAIVTQQMRPAPVRNPTLSATAQSVPTERADLGMGNQSVLATTTQSVPTERATKRCDLPGFDTSAL